MDKLEAIAEITGFSHKQIQQALQEEYHSSLLEAQRDLSTIHGNVKRQLRDAIEESTYTRDHNASINRSE